jgi:hypothetical protein
MKRRTFFKVAAASAIVLGAGAFVAAKFAPKVPTAQIAGAFLDANARAALQKIVPSVLGNVFSAAPLAREGEINATIDRIDAAIRGLAPTTQKEVSELMLLLTAKPVRYALTGIGEWSEATPQSVAAFLQKWRTHPVALIQVAYHALHDLIGGAHYGDPAAAQRTGFALPQSFQAVK